MRENVKFFLLSFFEKLEEEIEKLDRVVLKNGFDISTNPNLIDSFSLDNLSYPGISVKYHGVLQTDYEVWLRIEINSKMIIGYYSPHKKKMDYSEIELFEFTENEVNDRNWLDYKQIVIDDFEVNLTSINQALLSTDNEEFLTLLTEYVIHEAKELLK